VKVQLQPRAFQVLSGANTCMPLVMPNWVHFEETWCP